MDCSPLCKSHCGSSLRRPGWQEKTGVSRDHGSRLLKTITTFAAAPNSDGRTTASQNEGLDPVNLYRARNSLELR